MVKQFVGIDITEADVKMICLTTRGKRFVLSDTAFILREDTAEIKKLFQHPLVQRGKVRFSLQDGNIKIRRVTVPVVPKDELDDVVKWAFKEATQTPVEDLILRYYALGNTSEQQVPYLTLASERKKLQDYLIELQQLGASNPQFVEPTPQALTNCILYNYDLAPTDRYAVLYLDPQFSYFSVLSPEGILFYRAFSRLDAASGNDLTQFFSKLSVEIQYSYENYLSQFKNEPINCTLLSGKDAILSGLKASVEETLQSPNHLLDPFKKIELDENQRTQLADTAFQYGVAVGLAL